MEFSCLYLGFNICFSRMLTPQKQSLKKGCFLLLLLKYKITIFSLFNNSDKSRKYDICVDVVFLHVVIILNRLLFAVVYH